MQKKAIVWFRNDLRLNDNPAWYQAVKFGTVIPLFIIDSDFFETLGKSSRWWLTQGLHALQKSLHGRLLILQGDYQKTLQNLIIQEKVDALFFNDSFHPLIMPVDTSVISYCQKNSVEVHHFNGSLLWHPQENKKSDGSGYKVYSAFLKAAQQKLSLIRLVVPKPSNADFAQLQHAYQSIDLMTPDDDVSNRLQQLYDVNPEGAIKQLHAFLHTHLHGYAANRDIPFKDATSHLSAYLVWGQISVHQIWSIINQQGSDYASRVDVQTFLKELCWREFAYHVLFFNPKMQTKNLNQSFDHFEWRHNQKHWTSFVQAKTGYPLIDAGIQELIQTGYMHNRVRMVVASFLIKDLMIDWRAGERFFWDFLIDADIANNSFNWQWVSGSGYDAAPFFRIFNPTLQAKKFDPQAEYIKKWIPALKNLPLKYIFDPSKAPEKVLAEAGIRLGVDYPMPIVEHDYMRKQALDAYKKI